MRNSRNPRSRFTARQLGIGAILTALALGAQSGCTREFYRDWANQDVSEAVFEKSRDPRWRMDIFSVEPPALSRFADPYDQEVPPAPPDDPAAEALSPVPQWPDNRLLVPAEGTGYLDLLEYWRRDERGEETSRRGSKVPDDEPEYWQRPDNGRHPITDPRQPGMPGQPLTSPAGPPVPPETGSPFSTDDPALGRPDARPRGRGSPRIGPGGAGACGSRPRAGTRRRRLPHLGPARRRRLPAPAPGRRPAAGPKGANPASAWPDAIRPPGRDPAQNDRPNRSRQPNPASNVSEPPASRIRDNGTI